MAHDSLQLEDVLSANRADQICSDSRQSDTPAGGVVIAFVRRSWLFMLLILLAVVAAAFLATKVQTPTYTASASVFLRSNETASLFTFRSNAPVQLLRSAEVEQLYARSAEFLDVVRPITPPGVRVTSVSGSSQLVFTARGDQPELVSDAANTWAEAYVVERHRAVLATVRSDVAFIEKEIGELTALRDGLRAELDAVDALIAVEDDAEELSRLLVEKVSLDATLRGQLTPIDEQLADFRRQLADADLLMRFLGDERVSAQIGEAATVPTDPVSPNLRRNLMIGAGIGFALGVAVPYMRQSLNDRITSWEDAALATSLPVLGSVLRYDTGVEGTVEVLDNPASVGTEQYRALLTAIELAAHGRPTRSVLFTSPGPAEGKTTTAINVAALAAQYQRVLVVDADLRRPSVHNVTGVGNEVGLAEVLRGETSFGHARKRVDWAGATFDVIPAGSVTGDPALLFRGSRWKNTLRRCARYDLVVVDGPPVLSVTDPVLIGSAVDAQVLVVRAGTTRRKSLSAAYELLAPNGTRTLGVVVNRQAPSRSLAGYEDRYAASAAAAAGSASARD